MPNFRLQEGLKGSQGVIRSKGDRQLKEFVAAFAAISLLAAAVYAQSLAKASNRAGGDQQMEQVALGKIS
jgi:hypothetical protein